MRIYEKEQIEKFILLLKQVNIQIKNKIRKIMFELIIEECSQAIVLIGQIVEKGQEKEQKLFILLKNYLVDLEKIYLRYNEHDILEDYKILFFWQEEIEKLFNEIEICYEVVFLPYKASMWDSFESIWRATKEDKSCEAYVIPIPYYDKDTEGNFKKMHYEGELYPDYVPITDYQVYNFSERKPDIIFIHNPYDDCNIVTSVHPDFYSKRLKYFTKKLVYIPYFILPEINPSNVEGVKMIEHFCKTPGVINADKVIVQSENMRQIYINVMLEFTKSKNRSYWANKILGLGSPKVDKVLSISRDELIIPKEWLEIIKKSDGTWKKIVLYNTSIACLLNSNEKMLKKIKAVFWEFEQNKEEIALLWRPHPLIRETIETMRPVLWNEYQKIVKQYQNQAWGIYDDTPDLNRAIALCDAYYGDWSSIVWLCQKVGKPIMIQEA